MKLCSSLYNTLPKELKEKVDLLKHNSFIYDLNGGLQFMLKKYYDIRADNKSNTSTSEKSDNKSDNKSEYSFQSNTDVKDMKKFIINKHINDLNDLNIKDNDLDIKDNNDNISDLDYDYDLTFIHHNIIPINISIDIKDRYEKIIKHIKLKKDTRIIDIPIFCHDWTTFIWN